MRNLLATLPSRAAKGVFVGLLSLTLCAFALAQSVYYVRAGATGNGFSWANAFGSIQQAINAAPAGSEIRVAQGTYNERLTIPRDIQLKGGYAGTGANPDDRNIGQYLTIIDAGNAGRAITITHNASNDLLIEGFIIQNGRGTSVDGDIYGGGLYLYSGSPTIRSNWFRNNGAIATGSADAGGGAIFVYEGSPIIVNNLFTNNTASANRPAAPNSAGGAIYVYEGAPIVENNIFSGNTASASGTFVPDASGGAVFIYDSNNAQIRGNLFAGNSASASGTLSPSADGGAIWIYEGTGANIYNNTFFGNQAVAGSLQRTGSAIWAYQVNLDIRNNIFAGHQAAPVYHSGARSTAASISYCSFFNTAPFDTDGSGVQLGSNNLFNQDPQFVDPNNNDFRLQASSPCRNAGDTSVVDWSTDLAGNPRVRENVVDIGAYEFQPGGGGPQGDVDGNGCVDDADLLAVLFAFGQSGSNPADVNGDSVVDDADLLIVLFNFGQGCGG